MSTLYAFLHPEAPENKEIIISERFKDENGKSVPFVIRAVTEEENSALRKQATRTYKDKTGATVRDFDSARFSRLFVIAGTVKPDFRDKELCDAYGVIDPEMVIGKMLLAGEATKLSSAIAELSGMTDEAAADVAEEAKN